MIRGINLKHYYNLFVNLSEGNTGELTKTEYKKQILEQLAIDLEKNFINGHICKEDIEQIQRLDYLAHIKINYYPTMSGTKQTIYINFFHDYVLFNGFYIQY